MSHHLSQKLLDADPRAKPFELEGGPEAVLLIHGFTGTPAEMRPIADVISKNLRWKVLAPLLPGHGTVASDLAKCKAHQWIDHAEDSWASLRKQYQRIHLVGLSMGAAICLEIFRRHPKDIASLSFVVPAIWLRTWVKKTAALILPKLWLPKALAYVSKEKPHPDHVAYSHYPIKAAGELLKVCKQAQTLPPTKSPPAMIIYSKTDETVHPKSAFFLKERLLNAKNQFIEIERSNHIVTIDQAKSQVLDAFLNFYRDISKS